MLTIKFIVENKETVINRLSVRNIDVRQQIEDIIDLDKTRRRKINELEKNQAKLNSYAKQIGQLFKQGKKEEATQIQKETVVLKDTSKKLASELSEIEDKINTILTQIPNIPHPSVPAGKTSGDNEIVKEGGEIKSLCDNALPHWELAKKYDIIDFELGTKITGAGFPVYKGKGAKLQRALINFFLDQAEKEGYKEILPPIVVNEDSGFGTGQLPDKEGQMYHIQTDNFYLVPTAEVPVTNIYRNVVIGEEQFPVKNTAYTPCFRREAGSYGKDVRGLNRLHQFDKVEIVRIEHPKDSYKALDEMVAYVESLVKKLNLPYRIVRLCGGDLGFTSALTYDFEVYSIAQNKWLEVSSVSNFEDFQSNRLKLRYKDRETKKNKLAHTLNGSALALPRIVAAILENNQTGKQINIPEVLVKYTGFDKID